MNASFPTSNCTEGLLPMLDTITPATYLGFEIPDPSHLSFAIPKACTR